MKTIRTKAGHAVIRTESALTDLTHLKDVVIVTREKDPAVTIGETEVTQTVATGMTMEIVPIVEIVLIMEADPTEAEITPLIAQDALGPIMEIHETTATTRATDLIAVAGVNAADRDGETRIAATEATDLTAEMIPTSAEAEDIQDETRAQDNDPVVLKEEGHSVAALEEDNKAEDAWMSDIYVRNTLPHWKQSRKDQFVSTDILPAPDFAPDAKPMNTSKTD